VSLAEVLGIIVGLCLGAYVGWEAGDTARRIRRAREDAAYAHGVLDRDRDLRPDAGKGGPQVLEGDQ
jgi:hypothetical protein